VSQYVQIYSG